MTPERWQHIDHLFHQALALPPDDRPAFLDEACEDDLRPHVEALLRADADTTSLLDASPDTLAVMLDVSPVPGLSEGDAIDSYRLAGEIGQGGMGVVYRAHDEHLDRDVALKLVKRGLDSDEILRRFRYERRILAALQHPNIAQLYDAGVSDDGRPYLVMEYVDGRPIDDFCDEPKLNIEQRLDLFLTVCEAVQYAHQNLVVHRDLKPGNILVADEPGSGPGHARVKLLDFGIAKLLSEEHPDHSAPMTRTGVRVMTPEYAAPEQVRGDLITTATDVYALGLILYKLLTGQRPYKTSSQSRYATEQAVLHQEPERPSRATASDRLQRRLRGDLDTIILKALRKEPERRYASAEALAEDLKRHLAGLPVQARPDTVGYRTQKFVRRHWFGVATTLMFGLVLLGFAIAMGLQQAQTARERDVAREVSRFLEAIFTAPAPSLAQAVRLDTLRVGQFLERGAQKIRTDLHGQPALQGHMMHVIGSVYNNLALFDEAESLLEDALRLRRAAYGERHPEVAQTLEELGLLHHYRGHYTAAESLHQQVLHMREALLEPNALAIARSHGYLALALEHNGRFEDAAERYTEALRLARMHLDTEPVFYAETANNLGKLHYQQGAYDDAAPLFREAIDILRAQPNPRHPHLGMALNNLGSVQHYTGNLQAAEPLYQEALGIFLDAYGDRHPEVSNTLQNLATLYDDQDDHTAADSLYRQAIRVERQVFGDLHPETGLTLRNLALMLIETGTYGEAETLLRETQHIFEATLPEDHFYRALNQIGLGKALTLQGKLTEAEERLQAGYASLAQQLPEDHWLTAVARRDLGAYYTARGEFQQAETLLLASYDLLRTTRGDDANATQEALANLVALYEAWEKQEQAARYRTLLARG